MEPQQLKISDYESLKPYFENQNYNLCVYALPSILAWTSSCYQPYGVVKDGALVVCARFSKPEYNHIILPIMPDDRDYSPEYLADLLREVGFDALWFIPEDYIARHGRENIEKLFNLEEQSGYHDYVYLTEDLAGLKGNRFSKKRNLVNQFEKTYMNGHNRVTIEEMTSATSSASLDFLDEWCEVNDCDANEDDLSCERIAAMNTIEHIDYFDVKGIQLRLDGKVAALGIAAPLTADMGVLHFEKAFADVKGLYQYFDRECARRLFSEFKYINKENDMDIPGLAHAKKSYHPVMIGKSYKLMLKQ